MFEFDGWLDWEPDPERAARDVIEALDAQASLTRPQLLEKMAEARGGREWEFYQELFLNQCTPEELAVGSDEFIRTQYSSLGFEEICFLEEAIDLALRRRQRHRSESAPAGSEASTPPRPLALPGGIPQALPLLEKSG